MKRMILLLMGLVSISSVAYSQTRVDERQRYLNGPIQSLRIEGGSIINIIGTGVLKPRVESHQKQVDYLFDEKGNLRESVRYGSTGGITQREVYKYDENGRIVEESRYETKDTLVETTAHKYDAQGRIVETLQNDGKNKQTGKFVYIYDSAGKLSEKQYYKDEKLVAKAALSYDSDGRLTGVIAYNGNGDIPTQLVTQYDDKRNVSEKSTYGLKGNLEGRTLTTYNGSGDSIVIEHYRGNGVPGWKWEFEYDDKGNVSKEQLANQSSLSVWLYAYEYDSHGNWTKRTKSQLLDDHGKLVPSLTAVTFRNIKYYPGSSPSQQIREPQDRSVVKDAIISMSLPEIRPLRSGSGLSGLGPGESIGPARMSGTVEIEMMIDREGKVETARVISGRELLSRDVAEVEQRMKKRIYKPVLVNGVPVRVIDTMLWKFEVAKKPRGSW